MIRLRENDTTAGRSFARRRAVIHRQAHQVAGGRFCTGRVIMSDTKARPGKTRNNNTLPIPFHPPQAVSPSRDKITLPLRAKPPKTRLSWSIGRVIPSLEGQNVTQTNTTRKNAQQNRPPDTVRPSPNSSTLQIPPNRPRARNVRAQPVGG